MSWPACVSCELCLRSTHTYWRYCNLETCSPSDARLSTGKASAHNSHITLHHNTLVEGSTPKTLTSMRWGGEIRGRSLPMGELSLATSWVPVWEALQACLVSPPAAATRLAVAFQASWVRL